MPRSSKLPTSHRTPPEAGRGPQPMADDSAFDRRLVDANNDFGFRLLAELVRAEAGESVFISPFSIGVALAMTYLGARGATRAAMAQTLGLAAIPLEETHTGYAALLAALRSAEPQALLSLANSLWSGKEDTFLPDFVARSRTVFGAELATVDFSHPAEAAATINRWVADETRDKIKELLTAGDLASAFLVLVNAIYFKGIWTHQFDKKLTREGAFHLLDGGTKQHPMMAQGGKFDYFETDTLQGVALPFGEGRVSMIFLLPQPDVPFARFQAMVSLRMWDEWVAQFHPADGDLILPRFKIDSKTGLNDPLSTLGMGIAFTGQADFSGMCSGRAFIDKVIHQAVVEVNEEGAEAAAVTAVVMTRGIPMRFRMAVNRPFLCAIRDNASGAILFVGYIVEPA